MDILQQWVNDRSMRLGLITGLIGLAVSFAGRGLNLGRVLGDPLPIVLGFSQALRGGWLYLNWRGVGWHLLFILFLVVLNAGILRFWVPREQWEQLRMGSAVRFAAVLNLTIVALTEVDAVVVFIWYLMAGFISLFLAGRLADGATKLMNR
ncbi:hypothetical protein MNBD_CHLOROFLEXI01-869 [hydrothermal vent metagenome]|uniref:Uncharacterized protein n=1 Tax=hydrothermal vent metagenome TaxID=652676 RepID=A0A3B0UM59_9ZZZZ